jgi:hypothetical protein
MIPTPHSDQKAALLAIRKLASELGRDSNIGRPVKYDAPTMDDSTQSRVIDVSDFVDRIRDHSEPPRRMIEQLKMLLDQLCLIVWSCLGGRRTGKLENKDARDAVVRAHALTLDYIDNRLKTSLQKTVEFVDCIGRNFETVQRRDALVVQSAPSTAQHCYLISLHKIGKRISKRDIVACGPRDILASVKLFKDIDEIYRYTEGNQEFDQTRVILDGSSEAQYLLYETIVYSFISEDSSEDESEFCEISASRARDLFYGRKCSKRTAFTFPNFVSEQCGNVVKLWTNSNSALSFRTDDIELGIWERLLMEKMETRAPLPNEGEIELSEGDELISSSRAAALFSGRKRGQAAVALKGKLLATKSPFSAIRTYRAASPSNWTDPPDD